MEDRLWRCRRAWSALSCCTLEQRVCCFVTPSDLFWWIWEEDRDLEAHEAMTAGDLEPDFLWSLRDQSRHGKRISSFISQVLIYLFTLPGLVVSSVSVFCFVFLAPSSRHRRWGNKKRSYQTQDGPSSRSGGPYSRRYPPPPPQPRAWQRGNNGRRALFCWVFPFNGNEGIGHSPLSNWLRPICICLWEFLGGMEREGHDRFVVFCVLFCASFLLLSSPLCLVVFLLGSPAPPPPFLSSSSARQDNTRHRDGHFISFIGRPKCLVWGCRGVASETKKRGGAREGWGEGETQREK